MWVSSLLRGRRRPEGARRYPAIRCLVWLALLIALVLTGVEVVTAHRRRVQSIPQGFPAPVSGADVPTLGVNVSLEQYDDQDLDALLGRIAGDGFVWVRQSFTWHQIEPSAGAFDWSASDRVVEAVGRFPALRLVAVLEDDPPSPPDDPHRFAAFAAAFAERYGDRVTAYQIWDEPNLAGNWGGARVSPAAYADLLTRAASAIRAADPDALILLAGLAPTTETGPQNLSEARYLERLYKAGAGPAFDVVAAKPYGFDTGPYDRRVDESVLNFSRILLLRQVMVEHDDGDKAIWASHWGWNALPQGWDGGTSIWGQTDEETQASWSVAALERARTEWPWIGAMIIENLQAAGPLTTADGAVPGEEPGAPPYDPRWGFSLLGRDGSARPVYDALAAWRRSLPDGAPVGGYTMDSPWTAYEGDWRLGSGGADPGPEPGPGSGVTAENRATFRFDGTRVALSVRRGPYRGFLAVTVDGEPANALPRDEAGRAYVVLYDQEPGLATVPLVTGLEPGGHTVTVAVEGGHGEWPLVDWRVGATPVQDGTAWILGALAVAALIVGALLLLEARRVDWTGLAVRFRAWPEWGQAGLTAGVVGVFWGAVWVGWGSYPAYDGSLSLVPATGLIVAGLALPVMGFLFALRLDLGLALVALSAPFYLVPDAMAHQAVSVPQILIVLCAVAHSLTRQAPSSRRLWSQHVSSLARTGTDLAVGLLLAAALVASVAADDRAAALYELWTVFTPLALTYGLLRLARLDREAEWRVADGFILGGLAVALVGLAQLALGRNLVVAEGGLPRLQSVYHSPNNVGLYLGRVWPLLAAVALVGSGRRRKLYALALVPVTAALVLSLSRGALLLGVPASIVVIGWLAGGRFRRLAVALLLVGAVSLVPLLRLPRFAALFDLGEGTTFFRLKLWRSTLQMIREHPLFGVGPGNFLHAYRTRYVLPTAWEEFNLEHPHSILLDHWTRLGLLGLVAGLAVQVAFWRAALQREERDPLILGLAGGMAALLAHGLVDNAVFFPDLAVALALTLALVGRGRRRDAGEQG